MTHTATPPVGYEFLKALRGVFGFMLRVLTGLVLIAVAGMVAVMTAFVGLLLAASAIAMRYANTRQMQPAPAPRDAGTNTTLDARPTPRGWTVE